MKLPLFQIDAFASRPFAGNPAAVVLLETPLPDARMQAIAAENNLSETAFVQTNVEPFRLRWFTPTVEIDLCGHATLATAFVLFSEGIARGPAIAFETASGPLSASRDGAVIWLDFPSRPPLPFDVTDAIAEALGARPREMHQARDTLALYETEEEVARLSPRFDRIAALGTFAVIVTARGRDADFVSRFFAPAAGINEDPVTGSAHCTLVPFWSARLGKDKMRALQISARGGEVLCENLGERVRLGGRAVEYLRGEISF